MSLSIGEGKKQRFFETGPRQVSGVPPKLFFDIDFSKLPLTRNKILFTNKHNLPREMEINEGASLWLKSGYTVCSMNLERELSLGELFFRQLVSLFKISSDIAKSVRFNIYQSPPGKGIDLHFDARDLVILQISGSKIWRVSDRPAIHRDKITDNYFPGGELRTDFFEGQEIKLPKKEDLKQYTLSTGDYLIVPAGCWHCTEAETLSVSLALSFPQQQ